MSVSWEAEVPRLAKLARLALTPEQAHACAMACAAITQDFARLAVFAADLPDADALPAGGLRDDAVSPAPPYEVEGILAAAPRVDSATREIIVPRGRP